MTADSKPWYQSVTIWGAIVSLLGLAAGATGHAISPDDQNTLVTNLATAATALGGIAALVGRLRATKTIAPAPPTP